MGTAQGFVTMEVLGMGACDRVLVTTLEHNMSSFFPLSSGWSCKLAEMLNWILIVISVTFHLPIIPVSLPVIPVLSFLLNSFCSCNC